MEFLTNTTILLTISIGFCGLLLFYILKLIRNEQAARDTISKKIPEKYEKKIQSGGVSGNKSKKKQIDKHSQQHKQSQWLLTTLKGHTEQVLNIDISTNGKYLASCSEDSVDNCDNTSTSTTTTEITTSPTTRQGKIIETKDKRTKIKRRRRRKKRTNKTTIPINDKCNNNVKIRTMLPLKEYTIFYNYLLKSGYNPDCDLVKLFERYLLTEHEQSKMGYPILSIDHVRFYYHYITSHDYQKLQQQKLDVNAKIFVPQLINDNDDDSGRSSGNSSDTELSITNTSAYINIVNVDLHKCIRCSTIFSIYKNLYFGNSYCYYHYGKLMTISTDNQRYNCCNGLKNTHGCTKGLNHVFNGYNYGWNGPFYDYFTLTKRINWNRVNIYGIDCEMCYTTQGLEVIKLTIVNLDGTIVYDTMIKPYGSILDFNTRYSGITPHTYNNYNNRRNLQEVQTDLQLLLNQNTIIIGHGLENDLRCLKFVHKRCIDTAKLFPHSFGLPARHSLKTLVNKYLKRTIQNHLGHDSYEDACACIELVLWKIRKDLQKERLSS